MTENTNTPATYKETSREDWSGAAPLWKKWYEKFAEQSRAATELVVEGAQLKPGMRVLDLASGSGQPSLAIAQAVGSQGHVTATDMVAEMLEAVRGNAAKLGLANMDFRIADVSKLPFNNAEFDRVTCRFALMLFPEVEKVLAEVRRVLRPGGRVSFVVWGSFEENPYFTVRLKPYFKYVERPPSGPDTPGVFRFGDPIKLADTLKAAGFRDIRTDKRHVSWPWSGPPEQCFEAGRELSAPFKKIMAALPPEKTEEVTREVLDGIRKVYDGTRINFTATVILATATV